MPSEAISDLFVFCKKERETIDHLFLHCEFSHFLCCRMLDRSSVLWCSSQSISSTIEAGRVVPFVRLRLGSLEAYPICHLLVVLEREEC